MEALLRIWKSAHRRWRGDRHALDSVAVLWSAELRFRSIANVREWWSNRMAASNLRRGPFIELKRAGGSLRRGGEPGGCGFGNPRTGAGAEIGTLLLPQVFSVERGTPIPQHGERGGMVEQSYGCFESPARSLHRVEASGREFSKRRSEPGGCGYGNPRPGAGAEIGTDGGNRKQDAGRLCGRVLCR